MIKPQDLWDVFYDVEGEPELSEREDTPPPTPPPIPPLPPKRLIPVRKAFKTDTPRIPIYHRVPPIVIPDHVSRSDRGGKPLVQCLQKGQEFPWAQVWFFIAPWLPAYLIEHLEKRIQRAGGHTTPHPTLATYIIINPLPSHYHLSKPYFNLPNVKNIQTNVLSWHWVSQCYFTGKVPRAFWSIPLFVDEDGEALKVAVGDIGSERWVVMVALESHGAVVVAETEANVHIVYSSFIPFVQPTIENDATAHITFRDEFWVSECVRQRKLVGHDEWKGLCENSTSASRRVKLPLPKIKLTGKENRPLPPMIEVLGTPTSTNALPPLPESVSPSDSAEYPQQSAPPYNTRVKTSTDTAPIRSDHCAYRLAPIRETQGRLATSYTQPSPSDQHHSPIQPILPSSITPISAFIAPTKAYHPNQACSTPVQPPQTSPMSDLRDWSQSACSEHIPKCCKPNMLAARAEAERDRQRILEAGITLSVRDTANAKLTKRGANYTKDDRDMLAPWVAWLRPGTLDFIAKDSFALLDEYPANDKQFDWTKRHRGEGWSTFYGRDYRLSLAGMDRTNSTTGFCKLVKSYQGMGLDARLSTMEERDAWRAEEDAEREAKRARSGRKRSRR